MYKTAITNIEIIADFRSDTVTVPTPGMLAAMMKSAVGDDVFSEDATVNLLESTICKLTAKPAALFCTTGTMSNQLAIMSQVSGISSILMSRKAHVNVYEANGIARHCGAVSIPIDVDFLSKADVDKYAILDDDVHHAPTKLIALENPMNGKVMTLENILDVATSGIPMHLDGFL